MNAEVRTGLPMSAPIHDWSKLPRTREQWTTERKPGCFVVRVRVVRLHDGSTVKYFLQRPRPQTNREIQALQIEIRALQREVKKTQIVQSERKFIKQPYRPRRKKAKR